MNKEDTTQGAENIIKKYAPEGQQFLSAQEIENFLKDFIQDLKVSVNPVKTQYNPHSALIEISDSQTLNAIDFQKIITKYFGQEENKQKKFRQVKKNIVSTNTADEEGKEVYQENFKHMFRNKMQNKSNINTRNIFSSQQATGMSKDQQLKNQEKFKLRDSSKIGIREGKKLQEVLAKAKASGKKFLDTDFPPVFESISLYGDWLDEEIPGEDWIRPEEHFKQGYDLFEDGIVPGDIQQDKFGDCYLLSTLATLAEWPERIQRIFTTQEKNEWGAYSVWIVFNGVWEEVVVDDNLWYNKFDREFVSMSSNGNEIWPQLAEKAWAKLHGDYFRIDGGVARDSLQAFTGAPVAHFRIKEEFLWRDVKNVLFKYFLLGEKYNLAMCASTHGIDDEGDEVNDDNTIDGIYYGHSYSILAAYEINLDGEAIKLIKLRNPHGCGEYTGKFHDQDSVWKRISQQDKDLVDYSDRDDGIFFLEFEQLRKYFEDVQICSYRDNYIYEGIKVETSSGEQENFFEVTIPESDETGLYYFQLNQVARSLYTYEDEDSNYRYEKGTINVIDENNNWVCAVYGKQKNISSYYYQEEPKKLNSGKYYVLTKLKIGSIQQQLGIKSYGFGVYGKEQVQISGPLNPQDLGDITDTLRNPPNQIKEKLHDYTI